MGVLNVTPDSFTDGGRFLHPDQAYARALELEEQGADILDLGAESTRPESKRVSAEEEWGRLAPVLKRLKGKLGIPISIDTYKAETAQRALEYGIEIVNDPSGLTFDPELAKVAMEGNLGLVLNHMRGTPESWGGLSPLPDPTGTVLKDLDATASRARRAGVDKARIAIDPGLGFGKRKEQNSDIIAQLGRLAELDYPILVGPSRKSFLAHLTPEDAGYATAAAVTAAILAGAHMVRVHDARAMKTVVAVADEIARMAANVANKIAEEEDAERQAKKLRGFGPKPLPPYLADERALPMRPPLKPVVKPVVVAVPVAEAAPVVAAAGEMAETEAPKLETPKLEAPMAVEQPVGTEAGAAAVEVALEAVVATVEAEPKELADSPKQNAADEASVAASSTVANDETDVDEPMVAGSDETAPVAAPSDRPAKAWGGKPAQDASGDRQRPLRAGFEPPRRATGFSKPPYGDRPQRRDEGGPPRRDFDGPRPAFDGPRKVFSPRPQQGGAPRSFDKPAFDRPRYDGPPRRDDGGAPPRRSFDGPPPRQFDGPPRREGGGYGPPRGDGPPPRRDFSGPPPRRGFDGPPRGGDDRPQRRDDGGAPPRRDFGGPPPRRNFDGPPPRRDFGDRPSGDRPSGERPSGDRPFGDRPPNRGFGGPPRSGDSGGRPPYKPYGGRDSGPPREGGRPPFRGGPNDRPFTPRGPRPDDRGDRPGGPDQGGAQGGGERPYGTPGGGKKLFRKRP